MQAKAVIAILLLLTLSSLSWANNEESERAQHDSANHAAINALIDVVGHAASYTRGEYTGKLQNKLKSAVDTAVTKLPEIEKIEDALAKNEAKATWIIDLLTGFFEFKDTVIRPTLASALKTALPDDPKDDNTKKSEVKDTLHGMEAVWKRLTPNQKKSFKAIQSESDPKVSAAEMGVLANVLKKMAEEIEKRRKKETKEDPKEIAADNQILKALKSLEPLFSAKIFAALEKEYQASKDKDAYVKDQKNRDAWDVARAWARVSPASAVAMAFDPTIKNLADAKATAAKEKELEKSPIRKNASTEPAAIPSTDAKPVPKKVQVSISGPKGNEWIEGVQKEDGVHVTVNYPASTHSAAKSVDVVHTYKKASMPKDVKLTQSAPVQVYGPGINKSFPTVLINNEPYIVTADGYTHYKFVDFFGNGQQQPPQQAPTPKPQVAAAAPQPQQAKSEVKVEASVKGAGSVRVDASVSARAGEPTPIVQTSVKVETPSLEAVTVQESDFKDSGSAMVRKGDHRKAYESSLKTARAAIAGKLKDVQWEDGHEPMIIDTREGPVLGMKGGNGVDLIVGIVKNENGKYVPLGDCLNCGNVDYRKLDVFNTHTAPLPEVIDPHSDPEFFPPTWEALQPKLKTLASAQQAFKAAPQIKPANSQVAAAATPTAETPATPVAMASPVFIQPVDVSTVAFGYRAPQTYYNPTAPTSGVQTASNTATTNTQGKRLVRKVVSSYCRLCNNGAGGYIQRYVDVWE